MTQQIKAKQCGENAWYIPNQKGFVPKIHEAFWYCRAEYAIVGRTLNFYVATDYALINEGNCFETEQEALDAFVKPADPTPLTWDELCEIHNSEDKRIFFLHSRGHRNPFIEWIFTQEVFENGELFFNSERKYWRSKESLEAWIEQQKGE